MEKKSKSWKEGESEKHEQESNGPTNAWSIQCKGGIYSEGGLNGEQGRELSGGNSNAWSKMKRQGDKQVKDGT